MQNIQLGQAMMQPQYPGDLESQKRQLLAQAIMQAQAGDNPGYREVSGHVVPNSPLESLSRAISPFVTAHMQGKVLEGQQGAVSQQQKAMADMITGGDHWINPDNNQVMMDDAEKRKMLAFQLDPQGFMKQQRTQTAIDAYKQTQDPAALLGAGLGEAELGLLTGKPGAGLKEAGGSLYDPATGQWLTPPVDPRKELERQKTQLEIDMLKQGGKEAVAKKNDDTKTANAVLGTTSEIRRQLQVPGIREKLGYFRGAVTSTYDPDVQRLESLTNTLALQAKGLLGMPSANFSDSDREFLKRISGGIRIEPKALEDIVNDMDRIASGAGSAPASERKQSGATGGWSIRRLD